MIIQHDYRGTNKELLKKGYAFLLAVEFQFERSYSEKEKEENQEVYKKYGAQSPEWIERCNYEKRKIYSGLKNIMEKLNEEYQILGYNSEVNSENYQLQFESNSKRYENNLYDYVRLIINDEFASVEKKALGDKLISCLYQLDTKNIACRIRYVSVIEEDKVHKEALRRYNILEGNYFQYRGFLGKVKLLIDVGTEKFIFYKKGSAEDIGIVMRDTDLIKIKKYMRPSEAELQEKNSLSRVLETG